MHKYMSMKVYTIEFAIRECLSISILKSYFYALQIL